MIYLAYQAQSDLLSPIQGMARLALAALRLPIPGLAQSFLARDLAATYEMIGDAGLTHTRPSFNIDKVKVGDRELGMREEAVSVTPFGTLLRFAKDVPID